MERYSRNILIENIGTEGQKKLLESNILVAGCGGLGSAVISSLASVGVGAIGLVDNDVIELSNLNRQFIHKPENVGQPKVDSARQWIQSYNPEINVETFKLRLDEGSCDDVFSDYDLIVDCFDSYSSKFMLNRACVRNKKTLIHSGVTEFYGQVMVIMPGKSACLRCVLPDFDESAYVLKGVVSPAVSTVASIQAMEVLKVLLGIGKPLVNVFLSYDGLRQEFKKISLAKISECSVCK